VPTYGTYFGGAGDTNVAVAVAVDPSGNVIVAGYTTSQTLPGTSSAFQPTKATGFPDNRDVFVAKFDPTGRTLIWATFLGADDDDTPSALAVDASGNVYVAGTTQSSNFPAKAEASCIPPPPEFDFTTPFQQLCSMQAASSAASSFLSKLSGDGRTLVYSVGFNGMHTTALALNSQREAYVAAIGPGVAGGAFLFRVNANGTALVYGAYLGGSAFDWADVGAILTDASGDCWVAGSAVTNIPTTPNAIQVSDLTPNNGSGFVLEVNASGSQLVYGTWFGAQYSATSITSIVLGSDGSLYFAGATNATSLQSTPGAYQSVPGPGFIAKLIPGGKALSAFSYLPNPPAIEPACAGLACSSPSSAAMLMGGVSQNIYLLIGSQLVELNPPTLGAASQSPAFTVPTGTAFVPAGIALAPPTSVWIVGGCAQCSLGNLISSNAFQSTPSNPNSAAVLLQVTDEALTLNSVVNAASFLGGPISPGEIVTITGTAIGPVTPAGLTLDQTGKVATALAGVQVFFSGTPAPLIYVSNNQINAVVPYEIQGLVSPYVQVSYLGQTSAILQLAATSVVPALFTFNGSGSGPAAVLNQNNSYNTPNAPAAKASYVTIYLTGEGQTAPVGVTGKVTTVSSSPPLTPQPVLPVSALIGGQPAFVAFYGEAPGFVSGVMQLDVQIPANAPSGGLPLQILVGGITSQYGVTVSVQ